MADKLTRTVLIVEDELPFRQIYRDVLKHDGYEVIEAEDGEEALKILQQKQPDVILLDLILPRRSGYDVLVAIKNDAATKNIPVIVYSIMNDQPSIDRAMKFGAADFAIKGATPAAEVVEKVKKALG
jgi:CheY-like chemotaxis protein